MPALAAATIAVLGIAGVFTAGILTGMVPFNVPGPDGSLVPAGEISAAAAAIGWSVLAADGAGIAAVILVPRLKNR